MPELSPTFYAPDPAASPSKAQLQAEFEEAERQADMRAHMRYRASLAAELLDMLKRDIDLDTPIPGWNWEDIADAVEAASKASSFDACERMQEEQAAERRARLIAAGARAECLEKAMQS